jgi:hypothetical protein
VKKNPSHVQGFHLLHAYPNPFNQCSVISYQLSAECRVMVRVFDVRGREMMHQYLGRQPVGPHRFVLDAGPWESGIYYFQLIAGQNRATVKMVLVR